MYEFHSRCVACYLIMNSVFSSKVCPLERLHTVTAALFEFLAPTTSCMSGSIIKGGTTDTNVFFETETGYVCWND